MKCVPVTQHKISLETRTSSAAKMTVIAVVVILAAVVIALARKRGMFQHPASRNEMPEWVCGVVIVE